MVFTFSTITSISIVCDGNYACDTIIILSKRVIDSIRNNKSCLLNTEITTS